jgi:acyl-CoA synthetase (NDP forming)
MKVGGSDVGRRAAVSHTGAHWVPDRLIDAVFDRAGIVRFHSPREMIECANGLSAGRLPRGRTFAVLTGSGGVGVAMADAAMAAGLEMPEPSPVLRGELESLLPSFASVLNPIDHTAQILNSRSSYADFFRAIAADPQYDVLCLAGVTRFLPSERLDEMVQIARRAVPVVVAQTHYADVAQELSSRGLPTVGDPVSAVRMVAGMVAYAAHRQWLLDGGAVASAWAPSASPFSETHVTQAPHEAKLILEGAGIPFVAERLVDGLEQAMRALDELGPPVALKLSSASLPHKTDVGGVLLDIRTAEDVARGLATFADIAQRKSLEDAEIRVVMQAMTSRGIEILCGGLRDPVLGPVVTVGLGGILVEHLGAQECGLAPLDQRYAMLMLERLFRGRLRGGSRDLTAVQAEIVADILVRIGQLLVDRPDISEVELNPVIAAKEGVVAVDALVVTTDIGRKPSSVLRSQ